MLQWSRYVPVLVMSFGTILKVSVALLVGADAGRIYISEDSFMRIELEVGSVQSIPLLSVNLTRFKTRLVHLRPAELLIPERGTSDSTNKMLRHFTG